MGYMSDLAIVVLNAMDSIDCEIYDLTTNEKRIVVAELIRILSGMLERFEKEQ